MDRARNRHCLDTQPAARASRGDCARRTGGVDCLPPEKVAPKSLHHSPVLKPRMTRINTDSIRLLNSDFRLWTGNNCQHKFPRTNAQKGRDAALRRPVSAARRPYLEIVLIAPCTLSVISLQHSAFTSQLLHV